MKPVVLGTVEVWYKTNTWKAKRSGILNSGDGLKKPLEYASASRKFSLKSLTLHASEMKGAYRDILCSYVLNTLEDLIDLALDYGEDTVGDKAGKKGARDENYWLKKRKKNFSCLDAYGICNLKRKQK